MKMSAKNVSYVSPEVEILKLDAEGILCGSYDESGLDMNPEDGNM